MFLNVFCGHTSYLFVGFSSLVLIFVDEGEEEADELIPLAPGEAPLKLSILREKHVNH